MRRKVHPRYKRFAKSQDWHPRLLYHREAWVYRRYYGWWATEEQMRALNRALARYFKVKEPRLILTVPDRDLNTIGWFKVKESGEHWITIRGSWSAGWCEFYAVNNKCENYKVLSRCARGEFQVRALLHEWAHYLCYVWWAHGSHDSRFASVLEVVYGWYARRRKRETRREVRWRRRDDAE